MKAPASVARSGGGSYLATCEIEQMSAIDARCATGVRTDHCNAYPRMRRAVLGYHRAPLWAVDIPSVFESSGIALKLTLSQDPLDDLCADSARSGA
jgi:hypothetical protein